METCEVLIVGGGPAGSSCAWQLARAGLDVIIADRAPFPRDKVCAGWITPQVVTELQMDCHEYERSYTLQPITGFRVGLIGGSDEVDASYDRIVSYGIRRCEFDHYLLRRSGARLRLGIAISGIRRAGSRWIVNDAIEAAMLVGAGGHFCPVARMLNPSLDGAPLVTAQEVEFAIGPGEAAAFTTAPEKPELYFSRDLQGYGWCFRKQDHVNIGFGHLASRGLPKATAEFVAFLKSRRKISPDRSWRWHGHAYLIAEPPRRRVVDESVMLVGDAAGLAFAQSGEGIRPAIESGLIAASLIADAKGRYARQRLERYESEVRARFGTGPLSRLLSHTVPSSLAAALAPRLFDTPWLVRHLLLDRSFLRAHEPPLSLSRS